MTSGAPGLYNSSFSWGDFNQDGKLDVLHSGLQVGDTPRLNLLINTNGGFEPHISDPIWSYAGAVWVDFDGDGDLDISPAGHNVLITGERVYNLYRNENGTFTQTGSEIASSGSPSWADFDRDGDLDLAIFGNSLAFNAPLGVQWRLFLNRPGKPWVLAHEIPLHHSSRDSIVTDWNGDGWPDLVHLYRDNGDQWILQVNLNAPNFNFWQIELPLGSTDTPYQSAWGDYDNDGDLDIAFNGERWPARVLKFVRNEGDALTSFLVQDLAGFALSWADLDSDGLLDLSITEASQTIGTSLFYRYQNLASATEPFFSAPTDIGFPGASHSTLSSADFDRDGDIDIAVAGLTNGVPGTRFFRNLVNVSNPPPSIPTGLSSEMHGNGAITLSWSPSTDPNQTGGLTYNLWIRRKDSTEFLVPPAAHPVTGELHILQRGNGGVITNFVLTNLLAGAYEWSVQAVDNSYTGSPFAPSSEFTIDPGVPRLEEFTLSDLRYQHASVAAEAIANGAETFVWFEYGTNSMFPLWTESSNIGSSHLPVLLEVELTNLVTAESYFVRAAASNSVGVVYSATNSFVITNNLPQISAPTSINGLPGRTSDPVVITLVDVETNPENLDVQVAINQVAGANSNLVSLEDIELEIDGTNRLLRVFSPEDQFGFTVLRLTVRDEHGGSRSTSLYYFANVFSRVDNFGEIFIGNVPVDVDSNGMIDLLNNSRWWRNMDGTNFAGAGPVVANFNATTALALDDIDNDGMVDLAFGTRVASSPQMKIFTNSLQIPHGFRQIAQDLTPDFQRAFLSFADFDLDGDADLFATGITNTTGTQSHERVVWRNDGNKTFTPLREVFPRLRDAGLAWTDYNFDGAPDLFLMGSTNQQILTGYTELLLNDGTGNFTSAGLTFPQYTSGLPYWGDFDSDGRPDLLVAGRIDRTNTVTLYQNASDGTFVEKVRFETLIVERCFLGDFDADGSLDFLYEGYDQFPAFTETKIYLNRGDWNFADASPMSGPSSSGLPGPSALADFNRDGRLDVTSSIVLYHGNSLGTNNPPSTPTSLAAQSHDSHMLLTWGAAEDSNQANGLTYNVRVGRTPGGSDVISPLSLADGRRLVTQAGNAHHSLKRTLRNLTAGTYYWSVQAIDNSMAGGPFAPEQQFSIGAEIELKFASVAFEGDALRLSLEAPATGLVVVEASSDLVSWAPVQTNNLPTANIMLPLALPSDALFYRAVAVP